MRGTPIARPSHPDARCHVSSSRMARASLLRWTEVTRSSLSPSLTCGTRVRTHGGESEQTRDARVLVPGFCFSVQVAAALTCCCVSLSSHQAWSRLPPPLRSAPSPAGPGAGAAAPERAQRRRAASTRPLTRASLSFLSFGSGEKACHSLSGLTGGSTPLSRRRPAPPLARAATATPQSGAAATAGPARATLTG